MKSLMKHLLHKGADIGRRNVTWNIAGSFIYVLANMVLPFLIIWVMGDGQGGIFSFGFSTPGQQMSIAAYFGIHPFQITDGIGEYSFGDYLEHRNITYIMALAAGTAFPIFIHGVGRYPAGKYTILILLVIYKVIDGYVDVYESEFQHQGNLYLTGKSNSFRTFSSVNVSLVTLAMFEHLLFSYLVTVATQVARIALSNLGVIRTLPSVGWDKGKRRTERLSKSILLLSILTFLDSYMFSAAKRAIDTGMNDAASGYFDLIFIPTSVIYMVANFIIRPFLTRLTDLWAGRDYDCLKKELMRIGAIILGLTVLVTGAIAILGKWVLSVMKMIFGSGYEGRLISYHGAFIIIVLGRGFYVLASPMYYALVIMHRQKVVPTMYLAATAAVAASSDLLISKFEISGATGCYLLLMIGLVIGFGLYTADAYQNEKKENAGNGGSNT